MAARIEGYASLTSAGPGDVVDFHVRAQPAQAHFTMEIYRRGAQDTLVKSCEGDAFVPGDQDDAALAINGCGWPPASACQTTIPASWASGYYVAKLSAAGEEAWIPLIVRSGAEATAAKILAKISDTTSMAYNDWGGRGLYTTPFTPRISFDRPLSDLSLFENYQLPFIRWAEAQNIAVDYCSSLDLHTDPLQLQKYRLFVSLGHDEYWSLEMRDQVEAFIASGGNACFFSANTCFWQVRFEFQNGGRIMVCYKEAEAGHPRDPDRDDPRRVTTEWSAPPVNRPENSMTGVSYRNGAGWWIDPVDPARRYRGYTVSEASHWVFAGTGANNGDQFGAGDSVEATILGYETDATGAGTPPSFAELASADLSDWAPNGQGGRATMGIYQRNGVVFTAATVNWCAGLNADGSEVEQITRNLLSKLSAPATAAIAIPNASFENWQNGAPAGWVADGTGSVSPEDADPVASSNNMRFTGGAGSFSLKVDASSGETWISASGFTCAPHATYGAGCWAKASAPGASIRLQSTDTWNDFANAHHSGSGEWEYLFAIGSPADETDPFNARVKIQVSAGVIAWFDDVMVTEIGGS